VFSRKTSCPAVHLSINHTAAHVRACLVRHHRLLAYRVCALSPAALIKCKIVLDAIQQQQDTTTESPPLLLAHTEIVPGHRKTFVGRISPEPH
jgi:hypothetical protein